MAQLLEFERSGNLLRLTKRQRRSGVILLVSYIIASWITGIISGAPGSITFAAGIGISALFLEGIELWPIVYAAALLGTFLHRSPLTFIIISPIAQTLQVFVGAYLLRFAKIDPLFRRSTDTFYTIVVILVVGLIVPTIGSFTSFITPLLLHTNYQIASWSSRYVATVFSMLILIPFLLRWFAKPRFSRNPKEILETVAVFALLLIIDMFFFIANDQVIHGIPVAYLIIIPLFWIALRLRPRFVTLAMLLTSVCAVAGLYLHSFAEPVAVFTTQLLQIETFLCVLAMIFLVIVSLEEDRRLSANLLRSQVATLQNALSRISTESRAKNDFIAVLAHELRNPLAPVVSSIDLLRLREGLTSDERDTLDMMDERMQTVRRLLDDLLDISRISEGKLTIKREFVNLETVLRNALISTQHYLKERHQLLAVRTPEKAVIVEGDAVRLEQIFSNLITNASKYSNSGDTISISVMPTAEGAEIEVADTGVGIPPESLEDIFAPFHQIEMGQRTKKGLGIGLALVRSFVEMHGGTITASSPGVGQGSIFTVVLPTANQPDALKNRQQQELALVVDDNDGSAWDVGKQLELHGCKVVYAYDGEQALERIHELSPSIILLDLDLPDRDSFTLAEQIHAGGFSGPLIALATNGSHMMRVGAERAGFDAFLVKPVSLSELLKALPHIG